MWERSTEEPVYGRRACPHAAGLRPLAPRHALATHLLERLDVSMTEVGFQALAPEKVRLADNDGLMPRDESEGVFPKVPFRGRFL